MDAELKRELDRINQKLTTLMAAAKPKPTWVKASVITSLTGWNNEKMRQARENGYVEFKKDREKGMLYNVDSINKVFLKEPIAI